MAPNYISVSEKPDLLSPLPAAHSTGFIPCGHRMAARASSSYPRSRREHHCPRIPCGLKSSPIRPLCHVSNPESMTDQGNGGAVGCCGRSDFFEVYELYGRVVETSAELWALFGRRQVRGMLGGQPTVSQRGDAPYNSVQEVLE